MTINLIASFNKVYDHIKEDARVQSALKSVKAILNGPTQLMQAIEIYSIHRALMTLTLLIDNHLKSDWHDFLMQLDGYQLDVKGSYPLSIDTTTARHVLNCQSGPFRSDVLDLNDSAQRQQFIEYLIEIDTYTFREHFSKWFFEKMLNTASSLAMAVYDKDDRIVGGMWGFFATYEGRKLFYAWSLSIRPDYSNQGIGKDLIDCMKKPMEYVEGLDYLELTALHVLRENTHAKALYEKERFEALPGQKQTDPKIFMTLNLEDQSAPLSAAISEELVENYVLKNTSLVPLILSECLRRGRVFFSWIYWSGMDLFSRKILFG